MMTNSTNLNGCAMLCALFLHLTTPLIDICIFFKVVENSMKALADRLQSAAASVVVMASSSSKRVHCNDCHGNDESSSSIVDEKDNRNIPTKYDNVLKSLVRFSFMNGV